MATKTCLQQSTDQGYDAAFKDKFKTDEKSRMELAKKSQQNKGFAV